MDRCAFIKFIYLTLLLRGCYLEDVVGNIGGDYCFCHMTTLNDTLMNTLMVETKNLSKRFNHIIALNEVSIQIMRGEVTAIVGDNGSGKSTFIKILTGGLFPDAGEIIIENKSYRRLNPQKAIELGIRAVYQDLSLDNYKNCAENLFLGEELMQGPFLANKRMFAEARQLLDDLQIQIPDLSEAVGNLSGGQRQGIAIARALRKEAKLLILDEPTAAMGMNETESIFQMLQQVKQQKNTMLIVSHNLFQVFDIADRIFIMKAGQCIANVLTKETTPYEVHAMIKEGV